MLRKASQWKEAQAKHSEGASEAFRRRKHPEAKHKLQLGEAFRSASKKQKNAMKGWWIPWWERGGNKSKKKEHKEKILMLSKNSLQGSSLLTYCSALPWWWEALPAQTDCSSSQFWLWW
jgi:uncharacterized protein (DUF305 family)